MAEFFSNNDRGYRIRLWIDQISQDIGGNSSQVRIRLALLNTSTTFSGYSCNAFVDFDGGRRINWSGNPSMLSYNQTIWLIDETVTVLHSADGTKIFGIMAQFNGGGGYSPGTLTVGGTSFTLSTIPRSSSVSAGSGVIGNNLQININRQSSSFKHTIRYSWFGKSGTIASNVDTSTSWSIPLDFANDIPSSNSGTGTIYVDTYSGGTKTGTQSTSFTASIPDGIRPTLKDITLSDTSEIVQNLLGGNNFLQIISSVKVNFGNAIGAYGSTITGYYAEIVDKNQSTTTQGGSLGIMNYHGEVTIRATVTDSRGKTSLPISKTINVLEYFAPTISFDVTRTGTTSSTFTINRNTKIAPLEISGQQKNTMSLRFKVSQFGSNHFSVDNGPASGTWTTISQLVNSQANLSGNYAANHSWTVLGVLEDKFTSTEFVVNVPTESVVMSYDRFGLGVNKIRERGALDVKGDIYANDKLIQQHALTDANGMAFASHFTSFDNDVKSGYYQKAPSARGNPSSAWGILHVISGSDYVVQYFKERDGLGRLFSREKYKNIWNSWSEYLTKEKTIRTSFGLPYNLTAEAIRVGNLVTVTVDSVIRYNIARDAAIVKANETVPVGYRPALSSFLYLYTISGNVKGNDNEGLLDFRSNGEIWFKYGNTNNPWFLKGTVSYLTTDDYPQE